MKCARAMVCAILLIFFAHNANAITLDFDGAEYTATTAESIQVAWTASDLDGVACTDCDYEVRMYHVERKTYSAAGNTTGLSKTFKLPKTGHYVIEVRGCRNETPGDAASRMCSDWATSINDGNNPRVGEGVKRWRIYGRPAASGEITISK